MVAKLTKGTFVMISRTHRVCDRLRMLCLCQESCVQIKLMSVRVSAKNMRIAFTWSLNRYPVEMHEKI